MDSHAHIEHIEDEEDIANVKLSHVTQTLIVEAVNNLPDHPDHGPPHKMRSPDMPNHGMMLKSWLDFSTPRVLMNGRADGMIVIHSIEARRATPEACELAGRPCDSMWATHANRPSAGSRRVARSPMIGERDPLA